MSLAPGTQLGPYEIVAPIGASGMGEVYKARDTRLGRIVAIKVCAAQFSERFEREARAIATNLGEDGKVLPEAFARGVDRMARFECEAQVPRRPQSPQHRGYLQSGRARARDGLVEGETLSGPLPTETALD